MLTVVGSSRMARGNRRRPGCVQQSPQRTVDAVANTSLKIEDFFDVHIKAECEIKSEPVSTLPLTSPLPVDMAKLQKENVPGTLNADAVKVRKRNRTVPKKKVQFSKQLCKSPEIIKEKFITDYFQPRRSHRKTKAEVLKSQRSLMEDKIIYGDESGFEIVEFEGKGRGVVANHDLKAGDYVLEYAGDLIDVKEARRREEMYAHDTTVGCYMYYFRHENINYCVDATQESDRLGRLINHSIKGANLRTKSITVGGRARLVFLAKRDIVTGDELLYDYGDRSKLSLQSHPWLKN